MDEFVLCNFVVIEKLIFSLERIFPHRSVRISNSKSGLISVYELIRFEIFRSNLEQRKKTNDPQPQDLDHRCEEEN